MILLFSTLLPATVLETAASMSYSAFAQPRTAAPTRSVMPPTMARPVAAGTVSAGARTGDYAAQASRYRDAELAPASPGQLVVLLFDKCILTVRRAEAAFAAGDIGARADHLCAALDMVTGLRTSLDFDHGGTLSVELDNLYSYIGRELHAANREQNPAKLIPVLQVLGELRAGFAGAVAQLAAASQSAAPLVT